jgi:acyl dehydratase
MLRRGSGGAPTQDAEGSAAKDPENGSGTKPAERKSPSRASAQWHLPGDLGRRYGAVSGDRNPIHTHALSAKLFGFPRAIAHGMWSLAHCLAALEGPLPDRFTIDVRFGRPILLPATVNFTETATAEGIEIELTDTDAKQTHLSAAVHNRVQGP